MWEPAADGRGHPPSLSASPFAARAAFPRRLRDTAPRVIDYLLAVRSNEIFSRMTPEQALSFLEELRKDAPSVARIAMSAASQAFKLRPQFLKKQPRARQAEWMRRALARVMMAPAAEEVLAEYFLEHRSDLLTELLDAFGIEHEEGRLTGDPPECPEATKLDLALGEFRGGKEPETRELLLNAFAAQSSIDWPELEARL